MTVERIRGVGSLRTLSVPAPVPPAVASAFTPTPTGAPGERSGALRGYAWGLAVLASCTLLALASAMLLRLADLVVIFPLGVFLVATRFGIRPAVATAVGGVLVYDYLFVAPAGTLDVGDTKGALTLVFTLAAAAVASALAEQLRRQAGQARRQAEIERVRNTLLSALSHDLRTPLTAIVGASAALRDGALEPEERVELTRMVADEATRLHRLVAHLLELTRLDASVSLQRTPQAIDEVIGAALRRLGPALHGRPVRTVVPQEIPLTPFDPMLVDQVVTNLLENAIRHTPAGSPIEITVSRARRAVVVEVADRGPGVPEGEQARVFERLYRGGRGARGDGAGLGLTICHAIVSAHGGQIALENRTGGGAAVRFTLPIRDEATTFAETAEPTELAAP